MPSTNMLYAHVQIPVILPDFVTLMIFYFILTETAWTKMELVFVVHEERLVGNGEPQTQNSEIQH
jgi:hypothetical protein